MTYLISEYDEGKASTHLGTWEAVTSTDAAELLEDRTGMSRDECVEAISEVDADGNFEWEDPEEGRHTVEVKRGEG